MNSNQKVTAITVASILAAMLLFPPYEPGLSCELYDFILRPYGFCVINIPRLLVQWLGVIVIGGIVYWVQKDEED